MKNLNAFMKSQYKNCIQNHIASYIFILSLVMRPPLQKYTVVVPWLYYASFIHIVGLSSLTKWTYTLVPWNILQIQRHMKFYFVFTKVLPSDTITVLWYCKSISKEIFN